MHICVVHTVELPYLYVLKYCQRALVNIRIPTALRHSTSTLGDLVPNLEGVQKGVL